MRFVRPLFLILTMALASACMNEGQAQQPPKPQAPQAPMSQAPQAPMSQAPQAPMSQAPQAPKSLYQRLGGYDAIAAVSDEFIARLATDPQFGRFFSGFSADSKIRLRQHLVNQLCQATGGPCYYVGRSMKQVHTGLMITEAEWAAAGNHMIGTLTKFNVPAKERDEVMAIMASVKGDIVGQ